MVPVIRVSTPPITHPTIRAGVHLFAAPAGRDRSESPLIRQTLPTASGTGPGRGTRRPGPTYLLHDTNPPVLIIISQGMDPIGLPDNSSDRYRTVDGEDLRNAEVRSSRLKPRWKC